MHLAGGGDLVHAFRGQPSKESRGFPMDVRNTPARRELGLPPAPLVVFVCRFCTRLLCMWSGAWSIQVQTYHDPILSRKRNPRDFFLCSCPPTSTPTPNSSPPCHGTACPHPPINMARSYVHYERIPVPAAHSLHVSSVLWPSAHLLCSCFHMILPIKTK